MHDRHEKLKARHIAVGALVAAAGIAVSTSNASDDAYAHLPDSLVLSGVVRDFEERSMPGGHVDFERRPASGFGHYMGNVSPQLDQDGKPAFVGGGFKVSQQWRDASGRPIHPSLYDAELGDQAGAEGVTDDGGIDSADSFSQWFRNVPGVNMAKELPIKLVRQPGTNVYVFDDRNDPAFADKGGFFPVNGDLLGNSSGESKNFHFTYELATTFIYQPDQGHVFKFRGDDDVWVFVNGQLAIDIGGVHSAVEQTIELDRLDHLKPNQVNTLHFFFAERHRTQSNFRIETTLNLRTAELPNTSHLLD
jgi:fibro-slime domain-containing protein